MLLIPLKHLDARPIFFCSHPGLVPSTSFPVDWLVPFLYEFSELGIWEMTGEGVAMGL